MTSLMPAVYAFAALAAIFGTYLFVTWLTTSDAARRARVEALGPLMELTDSRPEARPASSSGDQGAVSAAANPANAAPSKNIIEGKSRDEQ